jgi:hypothetical protein
MVAEQVRLNDERRLRLPEVVRRGHQNQVAALHFQSLTAWVREELHRLLLTEGNPQSEDLSAGFLGESRPGHRDFAIRPLGYS